VAELERANTEIALLEEELTIKDSRRSRIAPRRRPYYRPVPRMRILKLKAARGWMTPADRYDGDGPDGHARRVEPRPRWPVDEEAVCVKRVELVVQLVEGRKHLPIVDLKRAAWGGAQSLITISVGGRAAR
jgi:hypothetical protein